MAAIPKKCKYNAEYRSSHRPWISIDMAIQVGGPAFWFENLTDEVWKIVNKKNN